MKLALSLIRLVLLLILIELIIVLKDFLKVPACAFRYSNHTTFQSTAKKKKKTDKCDNVNRFNYKNSFSF